jgi:small subunit ribosomal protein S17
MSSNKILVGHVIGSKMQKTAVVQVTSKVPHKLFKKYVTVRTKFMAHDEKSECGLGDKVSIINSRPISKTKRWRVQKVLEKSVDAGGDLK